MDSIYLNPQVYENLKSRLASLKEIKENKMKNITRAPSGRLHILKKRKHIEYYQRNDATEKSGTYIKKKNISLAQRLAQKFYDEKLISILDKEIKELEKFLSGKSYIEEIRNLYTELPEGMKELVTPIDMSDEEYVQKWLKKPYIRKAFLDNATEYYTAKGERVRSKSEIIIADALDRAGIPYKYEKSLNVGNNIFHPDFTILNVRERKEKYLEHLGMMDDREYSKNAINKINSYERAGYRQGKELILSWEQLNTPLSPKNVEKIIKEYLI